MRDRGALVKVLVLAIVLMAACRPPAQPTPAPSAPPSTGGSGGPSAASTRAAGPTRVAVGVTETLESANPYADSNALAYSVWCEVYGCLVRYDEKRNDFVGELVESWRVESPTAWIFQLHRNARWQDGSPFTAADVVHSFDRIQNDPTSRQKNVVVPRGSRIEAVDDHTIRLTTEEPTSSLLDFIADRFAVTSKAAWDQHGENVWRDKPVGTGRYALKEMVPNQHVVVAKHPGWWGGSVDGPDEVVYRVLREPAVRVTALLSGELQIAQFVPPHMAEQVSSNPNTKIVSADSTEIMFLAMHAKYPPWDNKLLRQAVAYAIDRDAIIQGVLMGQAKRLDGPIGPEAIAYDPNLQPKYTYNSERAKQLVAQAGFPNGVDVELSTPVGRYTQDKQVTEAMIPMLNAVGIRARLLTPEWATLWDNVQKGNVPFYYMGRGGVIDPGRPLSQYFETGVSPRTGFSNPQLDALFRKERATFDPNERNKVLREAMSLLTEEAPGHFMWTHKMLWGMTRSLDYTPNPQERFYPHQIRMR